MEQTNKTAAEAKQWLKNKGLKNPPIDSGISGGGDAPRTYVSDVMQAYARQQVALETKATGVDVEKVLEILEKFSNFSPIAEAVIEQVKHELKSLPVTSGADGWIRVEDRLPEDCKPVEALYLSNGGNIKYIPCIAQYTVGGELDVDTGDDSLYDEESGMCYLTNGWYENCEQHGSSYDYFFFKREIVLWRYLNFPNN